MDIVNGKLDLLDEQEKLLTDQMKVVKKRKQDLNCNFGKEKQNKINHAHSLPYENDFDLEIKEDRTFLPTAVVRIAIGINEFVTARAFMDTGAQPNGVSHNLFESQLKENLNAVQMSKRMVGINGQAFAIRHKVTLKIHSWFDDDVSERGVFWIMPKNVGWSLYMPDKRMNPFKVRNITNYQLADPNYWKPDQVHLLFGVGFFARIIVSVVDRGIDGIAQINTTLGIIIFGSDSHDLDEQTGKTLSAIEYKEEDQLDRLLERIWTLDQIKPAPRLTEEQIAVENHFMENFTRDADGRFTVKIPLKENITCFGSSKQIALKRFMYLERKLSKDKRIKDIYVEKIREMIRLGHIKVVDENSKPDEIVYHIPHHCIEKDDRIVYDASCKTDTGLSLNDIQLLGAKLQNDLFTTVMRVRRHRVAIYADIRKMFNQVKLAKEQWNLQRIWWRENEWEPLKEYWMTVVSFGLTSSAFLAVRCVIQAAREAQEIHPEAAKAIENDFYMDDCATGADTEEKALELARNMDQILRGAGFELRKWKSNNKSVATALDSDMEKSVIFSEEDSSTILGLKWLIQKDQFTFVVKSTKIDGKITKRKIASCVAQLYDPNGYIAPVVMIGRKIVQDLWKEKFEWDQEVSDEIQERWKRFWTDIVQLEKFRIDRWIGTSRDCSIQIHGFADASTIGYGVNVYVRAEYLNGKITSNLLISKMRVAPLKTITIPRLELTAAELLSRLYGEVRTSMEWNGIPYRLWTDSIITLHWIGKEPHNLKVFVANRVASIRENSDVECWHHVDSHDNPADLVSRGLLPSDLVGNKLWLHGPEWLTKPMSQWPQERFVQNESLGEEMLSEVKVNTLLVFRDPLRIGIEGTKENVPLLEYTSKLEKAINIICYVNRFVKTWLNKSRNKMKRKRRGQITPKVAPPTNEEKTFAMKYLIRKAQQEHFKKELTAIKGNATLPEKSSLEQLKPILDDEELLRLGGRLDRSELDYEMKHPYIIPHGSRLSKLIMEYAHRQTKHGGIQVMMQFIRQKYWIPKLRNGLRSVVHECVVCARLNAITEEQLMSELPKERVRVAKPFLYTGVDFAGPFELKVVNGAEDRMRKKCWVAIFVCLVTRAIHIEIVLGLTSIEFIACYERFIARRGRCEKMFSDNGPTFTGTDKELQKTLTYWINKETLDHLHAKGTEWHFMAPAAPHQGGIYEAAVKSMKFHLKRIVGQRVLECEQFNTLLTQIEAILNSRPLHPLSDDPTDMQALTPGHFLVGEPLITPLPFVIDAKPTKVGVKLWKERQQMVKHFWERWRNEYLVTLQERKKWRREKESIRIGQLVVLKTENFPPSSWALGRICELLPSKDGLVRTVVVETATNKLKRPVQKLCVLPIEPEPSGVDLSNFCLVK